MTKVFVADDHAIVRSGLRQIIQDSGDMEFVGESSDGFGLTDKVRMASPDVLVLDLNMPGPSGIQAVRTLTVALPHLKLLIFSSQGEDHYAKVVLRNGAHGYLNKEHSLEELLTAIRTVASGKRYLSAKLADYIVASELDGLSDAHTSLSPREYDVFIQLARGLSPSLVAKNMELKRSTVSTYVQRLKRKLNLHSVADMVSYAHRHQLVD